MIQTQPKEQGNIAETGNSGTVPDPKNIREAVRGTSSANPT
jgi:hypothetical protein